MTELLLALALFAAEHDGGDGCSTPDAYVARIPGYSRMPPERVRPRHVRLANAALKRLGLGEVEIMGQVAVAIECHLSERKGWHPGASLFERD